MSRRWTEEEDEFLRFAFEKRLSSKEMEDALEGRTKIAIRSRIVALGLKRNFPPREKDGLVRCSHCKQYKSKDNFIQLKDGKYYSYCNECKTKLNKEKHLKKKKEAYRDKIQAFIKTKLEANSNSATRKCSKCNNTKDVEDFSWTVKGERLSTVCSSCRKKLNEKYQGNRLRTKGF